MTTPTYEGSPVTLPILAEITAGNAAVLTGHAGTGKTTLLTREIIPALLSRGLTVCVAAFTHRACKVVRSKLEAAGIPVGEGYGVEVMTTSRLLGFREEEGSGLFKQRVRPRVDEFQVVIVDEASMIPAEHVQALLRECRTHGAGLLPVGDPAQLPPVGHKGVTSPAFELDLLTFHLPKVHRNAGPILELATAARECPAGKVPPLQTAESEHGRVVVHPDVYRMSEAVEAQLRHDMAEGVSDGFAVVPYTNRRVQDWNRGCREVEFPGAPPFQHGDLLRTRSAIYGWRQATQQQQPPLTGASAELRVIREPEQIEFPIRNWIVQERVKVPCWRLETLCDQTEGPLELIAVAPDDVPQIERVLEQLVAEAKQLPKDEAGPYWAAMYALRRAVGHFATYRYAMTVHKSQGGEWPCVFVDLDDISAGLRWGAKSLKPAEHRALMYVAFTRASRELHVIGG